MQLEGDSSTPAVTGSVNYLTPLDRFLKRCLTVARVMRTASRVNHGPFSCSARTGQPNEGDHER
jgi:hypothetical protein